MRGGSERYGTADDRDLLPVPPAEGDEALPRPADGQQDEREPDAVRPVCVGFSEIDPHASAVLRYRFPNVPNHGDITKIDWSRVPDFALLVGGSPCQDLSVAGKQKGLGGARSGLFFEYVRALKEKKPDHFVWENVKNVVSINGGRDFWVILDSLAEAGYNVRWQILNAKFFGVPQNRERIFIFGTRSDLGSPREVFFEQGAAGENHIEDNPSPVLQVREATSKGYAEATVGDSVNYSQPNSATPRGRVGRDMANTLDTSCEQGVVVDHGEIRPIGDTSNAIDANYHKGHDNHGARTMVQSVQSVTNPFTGAEQDTARTLRTGGKGSLSDKHNYEHYMTEARIRRLLPVECERLMSWPKTQISATVEICLNHQKNPVSAVLRNLKRLKPVLPVALLKPSELVSLVAKNSSENQVSSEIAVDLFVEISTETMSVSLGRLENGFLPHVNAVERLGWSDQAGKTALTVHGLAVLPDIEEREIRVGREELLRSMMPSTPAKNGKRSAKKSGKETSENAADAVNDQSKKEDTFTTSPAGQSSQDSDFPRKTLFCSAVHAIIGSIQEKMSADSSYTIEVVVNSGWTQYGTKEDGTVYEQSDTQRYKMCGNGVVSNVVEAVVRAHLL